MRGSYWFKAKSKKDALYPLKNTVIFSGYNDFIKMCITRIMKPSI